MLWIRRPSGILQIPRDAGYLRIDLYVYIPDNELHTDCLVH
jgi:hypothetical protein